MRSFCVLTIAVMLLTGIILPGCGGAVPLTESNETQKIKVLPTADCGFIVNTTPSKYTYENFTADLDKLQKHYGDEIRIIKLCDTADGREVFDIVVGDLNSGNQILIFAAMHAREYITTQVVMRQLLGVLDTLNGFDNSTYCNVNKKILLENVAIHFVPLNNPDGVAISQFGLAGVRNPTVRQKVASMPRENYEQWKANANGVDLNRNFDAGWREFGGSPYPSSERYKGTFPGSEPEAAALIELTQKYNIRRAISYHTCGALIYWYYKQSGKVLEESKRFANLISNETGYPLDNDYTAVDAAGYKDWAVYKAGVPSLTIEIGAENGKSITNPVPIERFNAIWQSNKNVVYCAAYSLR